LQYDVRIQNAGNHLSLSPLSSARIIIFGLGGRNPVHSNGERKFSLTWHAMPMDGRESVKLTDFKLRLTAFNADANRELTRFYLLFFYDGLAEGRYFYLQPFFSRVVDDTFKLFGDSIFDPICSALATDGSGNVTNDDNSEF
jgi:hypothetical protein